MAFHNKETIRNKVNALYTYLETKKGGDIISHDIISEIIEVPYRSSDYHYIISRVYRRLLRERKMKLLKEFGIGYQITNTKNYQEETMNQQVVIIGNKKSVALAGILTLLFGPLGMLYSTVSGAVIMLILMTVIGLLTLGLGLLILWPIGILWAMLAASSHNSQFKVSQEVKE